LAGLDRRGTRTEIRSGTLYGFDRTFLGAILGCWTLLDGARPRAALGQREAHALHFAGPRKWVVLEKEVNGSHCGNGFGQGRHPAEAGAAAAGGVREARPLRVRVRVPRDESCHRADVRFQAGDRGVIDTFGAVGAVVLDHGLQREDRAGGPFRRDHRHIARDITAFVLVGEVDACDLTRAFAGLFVRGRAAGLFADRLPHRHRRSGTPDRVDRFGAERGDRPRARGVRCEFFFHFPAVTSRVPLGAHVERLCRGVQHAGLLGPLAFRVLDEHAAVL